MTVLATDDFNRANGALGSNWTTASGDGAPNILSNECRFPSDPCGAYYNAVTPGSADYYCQVVLRTMIGGSDGAGPMIRCSTSADTKYFYSCGTGACQIWKVVAGTYTQLTNDSPASTGQTAYLEAQGSSLVGKINGTNRSTITDSAISATNRGGTWGTNSGVTDPTTDDWEMGDFGGGGGGTPAPMLMLMGVGT